ncbi:MAG TPA: SRPBCC domain-containing protein [Caulobacteraceae bacterium]|nr:SRPBCC domain-containing protein [Caulobacteraceae bacterium]
MKVEHRIGVQAPASVVWDIVYDLDRWPEWNPLYTRVAGAIRYGGTIKLQLALPGQAERELVATVIDWSPNEAVHWKTSLLAGLVRTIRYLEIEAMGETGCIFSNGEIFRGLLGPRIARQLRSSLRAGFEALGEAVRDRAEAHWRAQGGGATLDAR